MEVVVDLRDCKTKEEVLQKFGEIFGWTNWGKNWDALVDQLRHVEGGMVGQTKTFQFPLTIKLSNYKDFESNQPDQFEILKKVFSSVSQEHKNAGKVFNIAFA